MFHAMFAGLALGLAAPALAAQPPAAAPSRPSAPGPVDPARFAAAERLVALVMPEDSMRRMLSQSIPGIAEAAMEMSPEDLGMPDTPGLTGADRRRSLAELGGTTDPHFRERMQISMRVIGEMSTEMMTEVMPAMVRAYASHFARRLTLAELNELIAVFSTPTARKYTEVFLGVPESADFAELMRAIMPQMMASSDRLLERLRAATAHLPPPPRPPAAEDAPEAGATEGEQ